MTFYPASLTKPKIFYLEKGRSSANSVCRTNKIKMIKNK